MRRFKDEDGSALVSALSRTALRFCSPGGFNNRLSILIYHRVLPQKDLLFPGEVDATEFEQQLRLLKSCMNFVSFSDAVTGIRSGTLPPRAACVTFDDGYADNAEVALPILQTLGIPATFFVATGFLNGGRMWNDSVIETVRRASGPLLDLRHIDMGIFDIATIQQRQRAISALIGILKYLPLDERAGRIKRMCDYTRIDLPTNLMMTSNQVAQLYRAGMEIGGHTVNHPILAQLSTSDARNEIAVGKESLEEIIQGPVRFFAYPNGKPGQDYRSEHVSIVKELGFEAAVSTAWGAMTTNADLYQLPRFTPWDRAAHKFMLRVVKNLLGKAEAA
jgi:peptidoglycan/xylan/chitin deacetylase (PgdA/CDA1 family)